jgi:hypothetical protein
MKQAGRLIYGASRLLDKKIVGTMPRYCSLTSYRNFPGATLVSNAGIYGMPPCLATRHVYFLDDEGQAPERDHGFVA